MYNKIDTPNYNDNKTNNKSKFFYNFVIFFYYYYRNLFLDQLNT